MKNPTRIKIAAMTAFSIMVLGAGLIFCCAPKPPIVIGFIAGTTGRVADLGISGRDAVQMRIEEANSKGGINGQKIQLIIKNDEQDPEKAVKGVKELIERGAQVIIGPMTSNMAMAVVPVLNASKLVAVATTVSTQLLSGKDDFFFRVASTTNEYALKVASYHIKTGTMNRICAIYDKNNNSYCQNWLKNFSQYYAAHGGELIFTLGFDTSKDNSFHDLAQTLLAHKPDGILVLANSMDSAMLCQQIRKVDKHVGITLSDWSATERLLELGGKAVEGVTLAQAFNRDHKSVAYQDFRAAYFKRFKKEPGFSGVYAWEATDAVLTALEKQKKEESLKQTILRLGRFKGLQNDFLFDRFGDVIRDNTSMTIIKDNKFVVLE